MLPRTIIQASESGLGILQPTGHMKGTQVNFTNGKWLVVNQNGKAVLSKGLVSTTDQTIYVHLIEDPADVKCPVKLTADVDKGVIFDEIYDTGAPTMANVIIWL